MLKIVFCTFSKLEKHLLLHYFYNIFIALCSINVRPAIVCVYLSTIGSGKKRIQTRQYSSKKEQFSVENNNKKSVLTNIIFREINVAVRPTKPTYYFFFFLFGFGLSLRIFEDESTSCTYKKKVIQIWFI